MINIQRLRYYCAMVEAGGIHKAARRLGVSQPPLSMALKELEEQLGCLLVYRDGHNWIVTDAGKCLYDESSSLLAMAQHLVARVKNAADEVRGRVRAGFSTSCISMFRQILPVFTREYPHATVQAMFADSERLMGAVRERQIDFGVLYLPTGDNEFEIIPLRPHRLVALYSNLLPEPPSGELDMTVICKNPLLLPHRWTGGGIYNIFIQATQKLGLKPRIICQTQSIYLLRDMLDTLPAVAILPDCETTRKYGPAFPKRYIRELPFPLNPALVSLHNNFMPRPAQKLFALMRREFADAAVV